MRHTAVAAALAIVTAMPAPVAVSPQSTAAIAQGSQASFRGGVDLVEIAVLVRDRESRPVPNLTAADFEVFEDGVAQTISAFEHVSLPVTLPPSAIRTAVPVDVASNEGLGQARIFVLVLDAIHVDAHRTRVVRERARMFVEQYVGPADLAAVISPGALAAATQDFTSDKSRLLAAIDQFAGNKLRSATVERDEERRQGETVLHGGRDPSDGERANRAESLASVLEALARHLDRTRGRRTALLLFSEGIDYDLNDVMGRVQRQGTDVMRALSRAIGALQRANVSVYPVDPRGLSSAEGDQVETPVHILFPDPNQPSVHTEYASSIRSMRGLAEATGGYAIVDTNDPTAGFQRVLADSSDYYVLGYAATKPAKAGESRSIRVTVARQGLEVLARRGYTVPTTRRRPVQVDVRSEPPPSPWGTGFPRGGRVAPAPVEPAATRPPAPDEDLATLLASPLPHPGLPIRIQGVPFRKNSRKGLVQLVIEVPGRSLSLTERGGRFEERVELALMTIDDRARASNGRSTRLDLRLSPEEAERVRTTGVRWLTGLELAPGHHQVRVAARAGGSGATGLATIDVDVPEDVGARLAMSGLTLTSLPAVLFVTRGDGWLHEALGTPPSTARSFVVGDRITAAAEVYLPSALASAAEVSARVDWPDGSRTPIGARRLPASVAGAQSVAFEVDTRVLAPGPFVLRVTLSVPGWEPVERAVPFEVVGRSG